MVSLSCHRSIAWLSACQSDLSVFPLDLQAAMTSLSSWIQRTRGCIAYCYDWMCDWSAPTEGVIASYFSDPSLQSRRSGKNRQYVGSFASCVEPSALSSEDSNPSIGEICTAFFEFYSSQRIPENGSMPILARLNALLATGSYDKS